MSEEAEELEKEGAGVLCACVSDECGCGEEEYGTF